jgi:hypothetical protein
MLGLGVRILEAIRHVVVQVYPLEIRTFCSYALGVWTPPKFGSAARVSA